MKTLIRLLPGAFLSWSALFANTYLSKTLGSLQDLLYYMSCVMRKLAFCICENKDADQLISAFVFAIQIVQSFYFLNPKYQFSSDLLRLHSLVRVGPRQNPEDRFSRDAANCISLLKEADEEQTTFVGQTYFFLLMW